jgi:hypothetical protein
MPSLLACGPFFHEDSVAASAVMLLAVTPLAYFGFIQAFRYRVARGEPLSYGKAVELALLRSALAIVFIVPAAVVLFNADSEALWMLSWVYLLGEHFFSWWLIGTSWQIGGTWRVGAKLEGRRLAGWVISGALLNVTIELSMLFSLGFGWWSPLIASGAMAIFIGALHVVGRRQSLRLRFAGAGTCGGCGYDLSGNTTGVCPECGAGIAGGEAGCGERRDGAGRSQIQDSRFKS